MAASYKVSRNSSRMIWPVRWGSSFRGLVVAIPRYSHHHQAISTEVESHKYRHWSVQHLLVVTWLDIIAGRSEIWSDHKAGWGHCLEYHWLISITLHCTGALVLLSWLVITRICRVECLGVPVVPVVSHTPDHDQDVAERGLHCHNISQVLKVNLRMDQISLSKLVHFYSLIN